MSTKAKDIGTKLGSTLKDETRRAREQRTEQGTASKFDRAAAYLEPPKAETGVPARAAARPKVIRDNFTMATGDYDLLLKLLDRLAASGVRAAKSEVVRMGFLALASLSDEELAALFGRIERLRPQKAL